MEKFIYLLLIVLTSISQSQVTQEWVKRYSSPGNATDVANSIAADNSGNVYVTGYGPGSGTGDDYCTIKYNSSGVQQWAQRYNGAVNGTDQARSIAVDNSGNVYVTGYSDGSGTGKDYCTIKYNSSGLTSFVQRYNGPGNGTDDAYSIAVDNSGNVYVTGGSMGSGTSDDFCTIKYNSSGVQQWVSRTNGTGNGMDGAYSIAVDNSGNVYITGRSVGIGTGYDFCTIKYNSSGVQQWAKRYNGTGNGYDEGRSIAVDNSGNVYVTGYGPGIGTGDDFCTIKYNSSGVQQWVQRYNGTGNGGDAGNSIALDNSGNVYVTGSSVSSGTGPDFLTIKYNSSGVQQWAQKYNGPADGDDGARSVTVDISGNVYVTGNSAGIGTDFDYCTIRYNSSGVQQWAERYNGTGNGKDDVKSIAADNSGNVYVTGLSTGSGTGADYCTIKYHDPIGIKPISGEVPKSYELYQNYPNPFNPATKIKFTIPLSPLYERGVGGFVALKIYDLLGRQVSVLVNEQLQPGTYEVTFDASLYPSGVYFYKLSARSGTENYSDTKKLVLLK